MEFLNNGFLSSYMFISCSLQCNCMWINYNIIILMEVYYYYHVSVDRSGCGIHNLLHKLLYTLYIVQNVSIAELCVHLALLTQETKGFVLVTLKWC